MTVAGCVIAVFKIQLKVTHAQTVTAHLICIRRTDAFACGAYPGTSFGGFVGRIEKTVSGHYKMCFA